MGPRDGGRPERGEAWPGTGTLSAFEQIRRHRTGVSRDNYRGTLAGLLDRPAVGYFPVAYGLLHVAGDGGGLYSSGAMFEAICG